MLALFWNLARLYMLIDNTHLEIKFSNNKFTIFIIHVFDLRLVHENKYLLYFHKCFP